MLSITISRDNSEGTHLYPTTVKIVPPVQIRDIVLDSGVAPNVHGKISWPPSGMLKWSFVSEKIKEWENHSGVSDALEQADMGHL
jgi:hypothetical protein